MRKYANMQISQYANDMRETALNTKTASFAHFHICTLTHSHTCPFSHFHIRNNFTTFAKNSIYASPKDLAY